MSRQHSTLFTRADLDDFPDDGQRRELLDGVLLVSPLARRDHQWAIGRITQRILNWIDAGGHGRVYPGVNVELTTDSHLEPDIAWSRDEDSSGLGFKRTPEFVVEVLSPGTRVFDAGDKRDRYASSGCEEFWIVDIDAHTIEVSAISNGVATGPTVHSDEDSFTSPLFPGLTFDVDDLLR